MLLFQSQRLWQKQRHSHTGKAISFDLSAVLALTWACVYQHNQVIFIYIYIYISVRLCWTPFLYNFDDSLYMHIRVSGDFGRLNQPVCQLHRLKRWIKISIEPVEFLCALGVSSALAVQARSMYTHTVEESNSVVSVLDTDHFWSKYWSIRGLGRRGNRSGQLGKEITWLGFGRDLRGDMLEYNRYHRSIVHVVSTTIHEENRWCLGQALEILVMPIPNNIRHTTITD